VLQPALVSHLSAAGFPATFTQLPAVITTNLLRMSDGSQDVGADWSDGWSWFAHRPGFAGDELRLVIFHRRIKYTCSKFAKAIRRWRRRLDKYLS
jgi:hypothetical protein